MMVSKIGKLRTSTFKHIEAELYDYHGTKKLIKQRRIEIMHDSPSEEIVGGKSNLPSDPTSAVATKIVLDRRLNELERIVNAIEKVYESVSEDYKQLIKLKYWRKPQTKTWDGIAMEMERGRTTLFRWRNEIVQAISEILGWR